MSVCDRKIPRWKRILACILACFLCVQSSPFILYTWANENTPWDGETLTVPETDTEGIFRITTGAELAWFANQVNSGNGEINARLENTIFLNAHDTQYNWLMIGNSEENPYKGTFDGNGQRINYLYAEINRATPACRYGGLFGVIDGGSVSNLIISGTVVHGYASTSDNECYTATGGVVGYLKSGKVANCVNYTETVMEGEIYYRNAGGIAGLCSGTVIRCTNRGNLSTDVSLAQRHIGGIAGMVYGPTAQLRYCDNRATVQGYYEVGGIAGAVKYGGEIQACCNYGDIMGNRWIGGIAGNVTKTGTYSNGTAKECVIRNVYSLGNLSGRNLSDGEFMGGILGQMGYEGDGDDDTPSMPILENAYATVQYTNDLNKVRGAVVGYFKSGSIGNVYGMSGTDLAPFAAQETKNTNSIGTAAMKTETNLKSVSMIKTLGSAFVKTNKYDYDNAGFPKLAWQGQTSDLAEKVDQAIDELNSWLTEENRLKYGTSYLTIEVTVAEYTELLGTVVDDEDFDSIITEARETLEAMEPGTDTDNALVEAIDEAILTLETYLDELLETYENMTNESLTDEQIQALEGILDEYILQLDQATNLEQVELLVRNGKDALDMQMASYEEEKRLEEIRLNAKSTLEKYRTDEVCGEPWDQQIAKARAAGQTMLDAAATVAEVRDALKNAQNAIDDIMNQVPGEGAWDGITLLEPALSAEGVYQISTGAELAWFANQVNNVSGMNGICGELTGDINLGHQNWTPIGGDIVYIGSFDGNNYTVRGLKITEADKYAGLFGAVYGDENQSIVNLTVSGTIQCPEDVDYAGGIVGYIYGKNDAQRNAIENCHSLVDITISKVTTYDSAVGGIAGYARYTWFRNCSNEGSVVIDSVGKGGIQYFAGGIVGYANHTVSIRRCYNAGYVWTEVGAGGIVGKVGGNNCEFTSNYNYGEVQATTYAGGLAGIIDNSADGSVVKWSYNSGPVNLQKSGEYVGSVVGNIRKGSFEEVYALRRADQPNLTLVGYSADNTVPGTFVSSEELKRDSMLNHLNGGGNYFIRDYLGFQNGYPILSWQLTLEDFKTGAVTELQTFVTAEEYTEENWIIVQNMIAAGIENIQNAATLEAVNAALTDARIAVFTIETKAQAYAKQLEEAKDAAVETIQTYIDVTLYREEEQTLISRYVSDAIKSISLAETLEEVEEELALAKANIDRLPTKEAYEHEKDVAAAAQVDSYILNIGEVIYTDYVKTSINIARNAYDALTDAQKALVTQYQVLLDAEAAYALLEEANKVTEEDMLLAAQVDALITAIGPVTLDSGLAIQTARHAYDALTDVQKNLVTSPEVLVAAEQAYDELRAREVSAAIASIGEVTLEKQEVIQNAQALYDALTDAQKALVTDYPALEKAKETYANLIAAQAVIDIINQIGTVTLDKGNVILGAINAFNALTGDQQALVTNYYLLEQAAAEFDSLQMVDRVELYIEQIGVVNESSGDLIQRARSAYDQLSDRQKSQVSNYQDLEAAEKAFEALSAENNGETTKPIGSVADLYQNGSSQNQNPNLMGTPGDGSGGNFADGSLTGDELLGAGVYADGSYMILDENYVPVWEDSGEAEATDMTTEIISVVDAETEALQAQAKRKENILVLAIILGTCAAVTTTAGVAVYQAGQKRKKMLVHY